MRIPRALRAASGEPPGARTIGSRSLVAASATNGQSGVGVGSGVHAAVRITVGDTGQVRIDLTFAGEYELAVADKEDRSATIAYEYPAGAVVDLATFVVPEPAISWQVAGHAPSEPVPVDAPDPRRLLIQPGGAAAWLGIFHAVLTSARNTNCAVALPDRESIAVISAGTAFRVWARDPERWEELSPGGVQQPVVVDALKLVLLVEHTTILAYGPGGLAWESERLVSDDLEAVAVNGDQLHAKGFDAPRNETVAVTVDLKTGRSLDAPDPEQRLRRSDQPI